LEIALQAHHTKLLWFGFNGATFPIIGRLQGKYLHFTLCKLAIISIISSPSPPKVSNPYDESLNHFP